jgi:hypothetical protein
LTHKFDLQVSDLWLVGLYMYVNAMSNVMCLLSEVVYLLSEVVCLLSEVFLKINMLRFNLFQSVPCEFNIALEVRWTGALIKCMFICYHGVCCGLTNELSCVHILLY